MADPRGHPRPPDLGVHNMACVNLCTLAVHVFMRACAWVVPVFLYQYSNFSGQRIVLILIP